MKVSKDNGLVTISLSEKDAEDFAMIVLVSCDRLDETDPGDVGVSEEQWERGIKIAEAIRDRFENMGMYVYHHQDHNDDPADDDEFYGGTSRGDREEDEL